MLDLPRILVMVIAVLSFISLMKYWPITSVSITADREFSPDEIVLRQGQDVKTYYTQIDITSNSHLNIEVRNFIYHFRVSSVIYTFINKHLKQILPINTERVPLNLTYKIVSTDVD